MLIVALLLALSGCFPVYAGGEAMPEASVKVMMQESPPPAPQITPNPPPLYDPTGTHIEYRLVFSEAMKDAIRSYNPDFVLWEQRDYDPRRIRAYAYSLHSIPMAVIGDFNGDGWSDAFLRGHDKTHSIHLAVLSNSATTYKVMEYVKGDINKTPIWSYAGNTKKFREVYVFQPKGRTYDCSGDTAEEQDLRTLKYDGIGIGDIWRDKTTLKEAIEITGVLSWDDGKNSFSEWPLSTDPDSDYPSGPVK